MNYIQRKYVEENDNFQALFQDFLRFLRFLYNNFENRLLEQRSIIIDKFTVGNF